MSAAGGWTVVVLTGGESRRMGRDKATLEVAGRTLLARTLDAVPSDVPVVVAGSPAPLARGGVRFVQESPPGGGPVAGVDAALTAVRTPLLVLLATDLPLVGSAPSALAETLATAPPDVDAVLASDADGRSQQLCAAYRAEALRAAIAAGGPPAGASMRSVVARLRVHALDLRSAGAAGATDATWDIDTPEDAERLAELLASPTEEE